MWRNLSGWTAVRIFVAGDRGTGKSTLIATAAARSFQVNVPPLLPLTVLPEHYFGDYVPLTIVDSSSRPEDFGKVTEELKRDDSVVLTYASDQPQTLDGLRTFWLPKLREPEVKVPVIVVGCKQDLRDENQQFSLGQVMSPIKLQFREIENYIGCSALRYRETLEPFSMHMYL